MPTVQCAYCYRMAPTAAQVQRLLQFAGARRWVWNWALARRKAHYAETGKGLSVTQLGAELVALKSESATAWLAEMDSQALQQAIRLGRRSNQNFVGIPYARFIALLTYKAELVGIRVIVREEAHTSKCSFLDHQLHAKYRRFV